MIVGAVVLLIAAFAFVAAEMFLPTHGLLAILAAIAAVVSIVFAFQVNVGLGMLFTLVFFVATPVVFYTAVKVYPKTPVGRRVMLEQPAAVDGFEADEARLEALVGSQGRAVSMLRPAGSVEVGGRRLDAVSDGEVIEVGRGVEVVRVRGRTVVVRASGEGVGVRV